MLEQLAPEREKTLLDDDELQQRITDGLDDDPVFHLSNGRRAPITVEVDDGEATLRGVVRTALDKRKADIIARALGASTVDNQLTIEERGDARKKVRRVA